MIGFESKNLPRLGLVPADGLVVAGSGPLLLLLAWQYLRAGVTIRAILDMAPRSNLWRADTQTSRLYH